LGQNKWIGGHWVGITRFGWWTISWNVWSYRWRNCFESSITNVRLGGLVTRLLIARLRIRWFGFVALRRWGWRFKSSILDLWWSECILI